MSLDGQQVRSFEHLREGANQSHASWSKDADGESALASSCGRSVDTNVEIFGCAHGHPRDGLAEEACGAGRRRLAWDAVYKEAVHVINTDRRYEVTFATDINAVLARKKEAPVKTEPQSRFHTAQ